MDITHMKIKGILLLSFFLLFTSLASYSENGYELWLRYHKVADSVRYNEYRTALKQLIFPSSSPALLAAKDELRTGIRGLLELSLPETEVVNANGALVAGTPSSSAVIARLSLKDELKSVGDEGYIIRKVKINHCSSIVIAANKDAGVLYGVFAFLRRLQSQGGLVNINETEAPKIQRRVLNHWDNLNGTIERGYAGSSIWDWQTLPGYIDPRYVDYARANASVGINGTVLNNVNANAKSLTKEYLIKASALANVFRPYGIKVYLTARFSAPIEIGGLKTADPLDTEVRKWWKNKTEEIYSYIPDFGGFLVKANSEGQPGPQDYKRTHADGANMMAEALASHGGIVMWRAFVYRNKKGDDRAKEAYDEFKPLDGTFAPNVLVQPKYGPIDFQPREAVHPLFGAMPKTPLMLEFQITQEYYGFATHLVYLAPLFKEILGHDTYSKGKGTTVAKIVDGSAEGHTISGIAGVPNIGSDVNWSGHPFGQANWYAFGRLAWNPELRSDEVADEWLRMTFTNDDSFISPVKKMMLASREAAVNYMTPLGLNHIMNFATHYGPGPWYKDPHWDAREGYHRADSLGLGYNRSSSGSDAVSQYFEPLRSQYNDINTCPPQYLLWFHHVSWDHQMPSGKTMWEELVAHYYQGVNEVTEMKRVWASLNGKIDKYRYDQVSRLLNVQEDEARWWRDGCVLYFQSFSNRSLPAGYDLPRQKLSYYKSIPFSYNFRD